MKMNNIFFTYLFLIFSGMSIKSDKVGIIIKGIKPVYDINENEYLVEFRIGIEGHFSNDKWQEIIQDLEHPNSKHSIIYELGKEEEEIVKPCFGIKNRCQIIPTVKSI